MVQILHNNYKIPTYQIEDIEHIAKLINTQEFNEIYSFYTEQMVDEKNRLKDIPDYEKRIGFYLYYTGQAEFLGQLNEILYKRRVPTIQEFMKSPDFMGNAWAIIYPFWRDVLFKIFDPSNRIFECIFRGSIGTGKTTIARRGLLYAIYRICCLRTPHAFFKIAPDTVLSALMISVTLEQAAITALKPMGAMLRNTPCFKEVKKMTSFDAFGPSDPIPFCKDGNGYRFPNNVYLTIGSNINHIVGQSVFGCLTGDTEIVTDKGNIQIEVLTKCYKDYKVKTLELDGTETWNDIVNCEKTKEVVDLIEIELDNNKTIRCTLDHKFPIKNPDIKNDKNLFLYHNQWCKYAKDLTEEDELFEEGL